MKYSEARVEPNCLHVKPATRPQTSWAIPAKIFLTKAYEEQTNISFTCDNQLKLLFNENILFKNETE